VFALELFLLGKLRFTCLTCPYVHNIEHPIQKKTYLNMKEIDDVIGGDDAWENVDKTIGFPLKENSRFLFKN
jgi:hypothetical protein